MSIVVYYMLSPHGQPATDNFTDGQLLLALARVQELRSAGFTHVCISSELADSIGKPGVDMVMEGKTPDGFAYEWSKAHRAGTDRKR